jgi:hypothetical protein
MNTPRFAVAVAALGLTLSAPFATAHGQGAATGEPAKQAQADQQGVVAGGDPGNAPRQGASGEPVRRNAAKHPPTARMDRAMPSEKAAPDAETSMHPPTGRMDRATPEEKSPGSDRGTAAERPSEPDQAPAQPSMPPESRPRGSSTM